MGIALLADAWHAQGHVTVRGVSQDPLPSANTVNSAKRFAAAMSLKKSSAPASIRINSVLEACAPEAYKACCCLREKLGNKYPYAAARNSVDPLVLLGRSIAFNRCTSFHRDTRGPPGELTAMLCLAANPGMFYSVYGSQDTDVDIMLGAHLILPGLKLCIEFTPGTVIILRGGEVEHGIMPGPWQTQDGIRLSVTHFTHESVWENLHMEYPWGSDARPDLV